MKSSDLKLIVREKYGKIASSGDASSTSCCCTPGCCSPQGITAFNDSYNHLDGYVPEADLSLGCGIPVDFAGIRTGDRILDLGSGAGNDCFVARAITGESGHVTGIDFTDQMLLKAEENRKKLGYGNIEFVKGDIEEMPLPENSFDVVLSNCVLNLVPDKVKAFSEIMRVLKPGGHFCVSDIVLRGELSEEMRSDAELYAGCVSGASQADEYFRIIRETGFVEITVHREKEILLPEEILKNHSRDEMAGIFSITVSATRPLTGK